MKLKDLLEARYHRFDYAGWVQQAVDKEHDAHERLRDWPAVLEEIGVQKIQVPLGDRENVINILDSAFGRHGSALHMKEVWWVVTPTEEKRHPTYGLTVEFNPDDGELVIGEVEDELHEAKHHAHDPLIMWTKRALKKVSGNNMNECLGRDWDEGEDLAAKNLPTILKRFTTAFGQATTYKDDNDFVEYTWILSKKPRLTIELFTWGWLEETRRIGVCVESD